jgi:LAO/AO transport system kinase
MMRQRRPEPTAQELIDGVRSGDRALLARAITFAESTAPRHRVVAREVLQTLLPETGKARRIGITGVPGAGKSTFIEAFGEKLCDEGYRLAVLAVDPSSARTGGSILGDKTRMEDLSRHPRAFIRPSPSGQSAGGVAARTREAMLLCEAAGFDLIFVETVGVGQSEKAVRSMTDFFLLLQLAGGGDELQGIKKGLIELADAILVNKADGSNRLPAERARGEFARVLHLLQPATPGWKPEALLCSSIERSGMDEVWATIGRFFDQFEADGTIEQQRSEQNLAWFRSLLRERVWEGFLDGTGSRVKELEAQVSGGELTVAEALARVYGD